MISSNNIILCLFIFLILIFAVIISFMCYSSGRKCDRRVSKIFELIDKYNSSEIALCENTEEIITILKKNKDTRNVAILFRNSLLKYKKNESHYFCNKNQGSDFFNDESLGYELFFGHIISPNILTGLGVLGTFFGLAITLASINPVEFSTSSQSVEVMADSSSSYTSTHSSDSFAEQNARLKNFSAGIKTAFYTSIAGIFLNIVCSIFVRYIRRKYHKKISDFACLMDIHYPPNINTESALASIGAVIENNSVQSCVDRMNRDVVEAIRQSSSETADVIAEKVALYIKDIDDRTSEVIKATLDKLQVELNRSLQSQIENIKLAGEQYIDSTRQATAIIASKYEEIGNGLNGVHQSIISDVSKWAGVAKIVSEKGEEISAQLNNIIQKSAENNTIISNSVSSLNESFSAVKTSILDIKNHTNDFICAARELKDVSVEIEKGVSSIKNFKPEIENTIDTILQKNHKFAEVWADEYNKTITCAIDNLSKAIDKIADVSRS